MGRVIGKWCRLRLDTDRWMSWFIYNGYREKEERKSRPKKKMSIKLS
jgi:hypothetical protein